MFVSLFHVPYRLVYTHEDPLREFWFQEEDCCWLLRVRNTALLHCFWPQFTKKNQLCKKFFNFFIIRNG